MLQIKNICKEYKTGDLVQKALNDVSLAFRDNEFVAILGPSGSGKTTLLNIIGGLDRYDSGDLIINEISTKKYKDKDWDSYRNHTIGFVFQSYNLIPHQSVLSNVELALTISGVSRAERRKRAKEALEKVGLGDQVHKRPNQMSGGQMQRVAIARALVNDPDILLADEPTGALDSETSIQVMDLLKEVAKDRLVVMVTHNPELAEQYANRIVKLQDGKIRDDSNPYMVDSEELKEPEHKNLGKSSMSLWTSLTLSFNNLRTKKGRTILTAFAGSIGIIGIALILSISNGVNTYINDIQRDTMTAYPISLEEKTVDISSYLGTDMMEEGVEKHELDGVYSNVQALNMVSSFTSSVTENNLTAFKKYLDNPKSEIHKYIGENGIVYSYNTKFSVYAYDTEGALVNTDGSTLATLNNSDYGTMMNNMSSMRSGMTSNFGELMPNANGDDINKSIKDNYDLLYGSWPQNYNEVVLVLNKNNEISATTLYELGFLPSSEYKELMEKLDQGEELNLDSTKWSYKEACDKIFYMIPDSDFYQADENGIYHNISSNTAKLTNLVDNAVQLKITAVIRLKENATTSNLTSTFAIGYTRKLTNYLIDYAENSAVVKAQRENPEVNILNGLNFSAKNDAEKIEDMKTYLSSLTISEKAKMAEYFLQMSGMSDSISRFDEAGLAEMMNQYLQNPDESVLLKMYDMYVSTGSYNDNMTAFGVVNMDTPSQIDIYVDSFEDKEAVSQCITDYNNTVDEKDKISYTDLISLMLSSVTTIIDVISYVLIAFVAVSLIVSSIMIGIITYISVLERTKEIGILRAIGASKRNISTVFNAETFIIGLFSGLIGIGVTLLLLIPGNMLIHAIAETTSVNAILPWGGAIILVILSVILTLIGGFIPSKKAAKKDPVLALRTE